MLFTVFPCFPQFFPPFFRSTPGHPRPPARSGSASPGGCPTAPGRDEDPPTAERDRRRPMVGLKFSNSGEVTKNGLCGFNRIQMGFSWDFINGNGYSIRAVVGGLIVGFNTRGPIDCYSILCYLSSAAPYPKE